MTRFRKRGVTIVEALTSLFLLSVMTGMVCAIVGQYQRVLSKQNEEATQRHGSQLLQLCCEEVEKSSLVSQPPVDSSADRLILRYPLPSVHRYEFPGSEGPWNPYESAQMVQVEYWHTDNQLWRRADCGSSVDKEVLAEQIQAFHCRRPSKYLLDLELTVKQPGSISSRTFRRLIWRHCKDKP